MSNRGLSKGCPNCDDTIGPFHLIKRGDAPFAVCTTFAWGYSCRLCGYWWMARDIDKRDYPEEYDPNYATLEEQK